MLLSKSKVVPLKTTSITRFELLRASSVLKVTKEFVDVYEIDIKKGTFWCDSLNVFW